MGLVDEAAAAAVNKGLELFSYSIGDSMININGSGTIPPQSGRKHQDLSSVCYRSQ